MQNSKFIMQNHVRIFHVVDLLENLGVGLFVPLISFQIVDGLFDHRQHEHKHQRSHVGNGEAYSSLTHFKASVCEFGASESYRLSKGG